MYFDGTIQAGDTAIPVYTTNSYTMTLPRDEFTLLNLGIGDEPEDEYYEADEFVQKIIVNGDATIVFWADDTKTVVKWDGESERSLYTAFTAALAIKMFGSNSHLKRIVHERVAYQNKKPKDKQEKVVVESKEFVVGDKVRIKGGLEEGKFYGQLVYIDNMRDAAREASDKNLVLTIEYIDPKDRTCKLKGCEKFWYSLEMLELAGE